MKKLLIILLFTFSLTALPTIKSHAIVWVVVKEAAKKVIKAIDLAIQRQQNKVIWLQNAQKVLENELSKLKLTEISQWSEKQRKLFDDYYQELWKVKSAISTYQKVKRIASGQIQMINEYSTAWGLLYQDKNFSAKEIAEMYRVYSGILDAGVKNIDQLLLVANSFATQMSDGKRLQLIDDASDALDEQLKVLRSYNQRNFRISLSRSHSKQAQESLKKLYGLP